MFSSKIQKAGFTVIELIMTLTVIGILAVIAVARMPDIIPIRLSMAARKVQSDIRYAQSLAMTTQRWTRIVFSAAGDNYLVYTDGIDTGVIGIFFLTLALYSFTKKNYTI